MATIPSADAEIQQDILDELDWDPEVAVTDVGVEVDDGVVTLTGTVESYATKWAAERAVLRVTGVRAVANDLVVKPLGAGTPTDTEIARAAADALERSADVPPGQIQVKVADGVVALSGEVAWNYQRQAAEAAIRGIRGVREVHSALVVRPEAVEADMILEGIEQAFVRSAEVDAGHVSVVVDGGHVTLRGTVSSAAEKVAAGEAAWRASGVTEVTNELEVQPF